MLSSTVQTLYMTLLKPETRNTLDEYRNGGIFDLTCTTRKLCYIGHTSRNLKQRYQEHIRYIKHNKLQLSYALRVLNNAHEYGSINNIMSLLKQVNKGPLINSFKQFYFQFHFYHNKLISEQSIGEQNQIYKLVLDLHLHDMT